MLYELGENFKSLKPLDFWDFGDFSQCEEDLENLMAKNLFGTLFENMPFLPIHQERARQPEADIYALNSEGDLVIFELKRGAASSGALDQLLRYTEEAGRWTYKELAQKYKNYPNKDDQEEDIQRAHQEAFNLNEKLSENQFNRNQHLYVIGNAIDGTLISRVDYWRKKGLGIDFLPYRIYEIEKKLYFEFFAKPYDEHVNPAKFRGILFDTNRSYNESSFEQMVLKNRIAAYGKRKGAVNSLKRGDYVFYSHRGYGIVAAAEVVGNNVKADGKDELYLDVKFLTTVPQDFSNPKALPFKEVTNITKKSFYWARIQKVPYLNRQEAENLLTALNEVL